MFQVARFLQKFPQTQRAHQALVQDLTEHPELLPLRTDFEGNTHLQTYDELVSFHIISFLYFYILFFASSRCHVAKKNNFLLKKIFSFLIMTTF